MNENEQRHFPKKITATMHRITPNRTQPRTESLMIIYMKNRRELPFSHRILFFLLFHIVIVIGSFSGFFFFIHQTSSQLATSKATIENIFFIVSGKIGVLHKKRSLCFFIVEKKTLWVWVTNSVFFFSLSIFLSCLV